MPETPEAAMRPTFLSRAERDVRAERTRQNAKWGEQNHPDGTGGVMYVAIADEARMDCQRAAAEGKVTWRDILTEEFAEALAEGDPERLRAELIQVAAVAMAWAEAIDRRLARPDDPAELAARLDTARSEFPEATDDPPPCTCLTTTPHAVNCNYRYWLALRGEL